jgi:hypothetical protein
MCLSVFLFWIVFIFEYIANIEYYNGINRLFNVDKLLIGCQTIKVY